jgi:hypothetical protein
LGFWWSANTSAVFPTTAWNALHSLPINSGVLTHLKTRDFHVRAVRTGSCH